MNTKSYAGPVLADLTDPDNNPVTDLDEAVALCHSVGWVLDPTSHKDRWLVWIPVTDATQLEADGILSICCKRGEATVTR